MPTASAPAAFAASAFSPAGQNTATLTVLPVPCGSMTELRQRCAAQRPDLIVADFWGTSHLHLDDTERAEITALASIAPLVLVSARNWALGLDAEDLGVAALVPKPLDVEHFASVVQDMLTDATGASLLEDEAQELPGRETMSVFVLGWPAE